MGQYHVLVNLDKKEYVMPHHVGDGLKLWEWSGDGMLRAMQVLLATSNGRGGGDLPDNKVVGRWGGDRVAVIGDYSEVGDIKSKPKLDPKKIYEFCDYKAKGGWKNISNMVVPVLEEVGEFKMDKTDGWQHRKYRNETQAEKPRMAIDMVVGPDGIQTNVKTR